MSKNTPVKIANPSFDGAGWTSQKRALHLVRQGRAVMTDDGQLFFYDSATVVLKREVERVDAAIARNRGGVVFWNGDSADDLAMHRPGEVRC